VGQREKERDADAHIRAFVPPFRATNAAPATRRARRTDGAATIARLPGAPRDVTGGDG
jgi:hypothetical protein